MPHFKAIGKFKLDLQSRNAQFVSNLAISSLLHHFTAIIKFSLELEHGNTQFGSKSMMLFVPCDLEIWWKSLKYDRAPLLCHCNICASFRTHLWIQTGVTVQRYPNWGIIHFNKVERGVYLFHLVRLSVCGQNRVHSVSSTILIKSISYLHILSSNFRRCVACNACFKI